METTTTNVTSANHADKDSSTRAFLTLKNLQTASTALQSPSHLGFVLRLHFLLREQIQAGGHDDEGSSVKSVWKYEENQPLKITIQKE